MTAGEFVVEGVETTYGISLGTAVEHALNGLKIAHAFVSDNVTSP
jgi:hypothetical protein